MNLNLLSAQLARFSSVPCRIFLYACLITSSSLANSTENPLEKSKEHAPASTCYGDTKLGAIKDSWQLPTSGKNFEAYTSLSTSLGRNYVHSTVYAIVLEAYQTLEKARQINILSTAKLASHKVVSLNPTKRIRMAYP